MKKTTESIRYYVLLQQFQLHKAPKNSFEKPYKESMERLFQFIYGYTDIFDIQYMDEYTLYRYIYHHQDKKFSEVSFVQVVKDIKHFIQFKDKEYNTIPGLSDLTIDLSVDHFVLSLLSLSEKRRDVILEIAKLKSQLLFLIDKDLLPIYKRFNETKELNSLLFLDEILEEVHSKLEELKKVDYDSATQIYRSKIRNLPSKDRLLDEYLRR